MIRYLHHPPILLTYEEECANLLCEGRTYQLEPAQAHRLELLLRTGYVGSEARVQDAELIDFLLAEGLASLHDTPGRSRIVARDFRAAENIQGWLWARRLCVGFILLVGVTALLTLPGSYHGFVAALLDGPWLAVLLVLPVCVHEAVHYFTGKALGLKGEAGLGVRGGVFPVATITFPSLYAFPKHVRWLPLLAPMVLDGIIFLSLSPFRSVPLAALFHFFYGVGILWQFLVFLRTDIYLFVATTFNQPNLNQLVWRGDGAHSSGALAVAEKNARRLYIGFFAFAVLGALVVTSA